MLLAAISSCSQPLRAPRSRALPLFPTTLCRRSSKQALTRRTHANRHSRSSFHDPDDAAAVRPRKLKRATTPPRQGHGNIPPSDSSILLATEDELLLLTVSKTDQRKKSQPLGTDTSHISPKQALDQRSATHPKGQNHSLSKRSLPCLNDEKTHLSTRYSTIPIETGSTFP